MGDFIEFTTLPEQLHTFYKITSSAIGFSVRGERHAAVGLAKMPFQKCEYWIVFGQSQCWVEIDGTRTNVNEVPNILPRQVYTKYWISWHSTCLQFGRTSDGVPLITKEIPAQDLHFVTFFVYADRGTQQWKIFLPPKLQKPFLKRVKGGDMHWVDVDAKDKLPDGALIGGYEKEILYIMRASHCGAVIPGKLAASQGAGFIAWGTEMLQKNKFQVLCGYNCIWVSMCNNQIPVGAVEGGNCEDTNETLYIGRVLHDGNLNLIPGKVKPSHSNCYFPYNGKIFYNRKYEILVNPQITTNRYLRVDENLWMYRYLAINQKPQITMHRYLGHCDHRISDRAVHSFTRFFVCTMDEITENRPEAEEENVCVNIIWDIKTLYPAQNQNK